MSRILPEGSSECRFFFGGEASASQLPRVLFFQDFRFFLFLFEQICFGFYLFGHCSILTLYFLIKTDRWSSGPENPPTPPGVLRRVRASRFTLSLSLSQTGSKSWKFVSMHPNPHGVGTRGGLGGESVRLLPGAVFGPLGTTFYSLKYKNDQKK